MNRRSFLKMVGIGAGALTFGPGFWSEALALGDATGDSPYGPLAPPDGNGIRLPRGFRSRLIATSGMTVAGTSYVWHPSPDGGAVFADRHGGWIYVSNAEVYDTGGASMIRFDRNGDIVDARRILDGTDRNCAGGATPWGTWLSAEETAVGYIWECDPLGLEPAQCRPALGRFNHEAAATDPSTGIVYLTEDRGDAGLYRFRPARRNRLDEGRLEVLAVRNGRKAWMPVPDAAATSTEVRYQVPGTLQFKRPEGAWFDDGTLYFATTGDNRIWTYRPRTDDLEVLYDYATSTNPILTGVDNVTVSMAGDVFVAEDGGDMQLVVLTAKGGVAAFLQVVGQAGSEITGPAFSPDGTRLYFSSQYPGTTYEVSGPFRRRASR